MRGWGDDDFGQDIWDNEDDKIDCWMSGMNGEVMIPARESGIMKMTRLTAGCHEWMENCMDGTETCGPSFQTIQNFILGKRLGAGIPSHRMCIYQDEAQKHSTNTTTVMTPKPNTYR